MSKVQIFKNLDEYCDRKNSNTNGVTQKFLDRYGLTLETLNLINCKKCWNSYNLKKCFYTWYSHDVENGFDCNGSLIYEKDFFDY